MGNARLLYQNRLLDRSCLQGVVVADTVGDFSLNRITLHRGTTDCLGHVALITTLMCQVYTYACVHAARVCGMRRAAVARTQYLQCQQWLGVYPQIAEQRPELDTSVHVVFIASEEYWSAGVGVDEMMKRGDCNHVLGGMYGQAPGRGWARFFALESCCL
jgi:hypothetical protein